MKPWVEKVRVKITLFLISVAKFTCVYGGTLDYLKEAEKQEEYFV